MLVQIRQGTHVSRDGDVNVINIMPFHQLIQLQNAIFLRAILPTTHVYMALVSSSQLSCRSYVIEEKKSTATFEAKSGYWKVIAQAMRCSNYFLYPKLLKFCSRSSHNLVCKLLAEVNGYGTASNPEQSRLISRVSPLIGFDGEENFLKNGRVHAESCGDERVEMDEFDFSLAYERFSSIAVGNSPPILLYDESVWQSEVKNYLQGESHHGYLPNAKSDQWLQVEELSTLSTLDATDDSSFSLEKEGSYMLSSINLDTEEEVPKVPVEEHSVSLAPEPQQDATPIQLILDKPLRNIPGISSRNYSQLEKYGFHTLRKLLSHFPRTYADMKNAQGEISDGQYLMFFGKVLSSRGVRASSSFSFLEVVVGCEISNNAVALDFKNDGGGTLEKQRIYLHLKKFFRGTRFTNPYFLKSIESKHREGDFVCVSGKVRTMSKNGHYEMREYNIDVVGDEKESHLHEEARPYPLYPSKGGLNPKFLREMILRALQVLSSNIDPIPKDVCEEFHLLSLYDAYIAIHQPKDLNEADLARKRLIFDEFFYIQLARLFQMLQPLGSWIERDGLLDSYRKPELNTILMEEWSILTKQFLEALPYSLTPSQFNAVSQIIWDLKRLVPMNRLLQGDVGCGKTVVAFLACMEVVGSGYQAAFMVPTELLAVQHYEHLTKLLENIDDSLRPSIALLTGSTPARQARMIRQGLQTGEISLVIGTHSLIADKVEFLALRIAVVDEQHRFGVIQRGKFNSKLYSSSASLGLNDGSKDRSTSDETLMAPHVLAMSATPIPRTLALALYGDMSLTQITDLPPGRKPIETCIFEGNHSGFETLYQLMREELADGGKVYIVYPVIETSEQLPQLRGASADFESISHEFEGYRCGLLHGRMKSDEKDEALRQFRSGETHILLSTQVVEVGVDVPDASMMVVMNAERFGIAQLHQLRGRVGRGMRKSRCIFLASSSNALNRLKVLEKSSDGFHLANVDLLLRGPGDLLGKKQSGHIPEFPIARLEVDGNILEEAHLAALKILSVSHDLESFPKLKAELSMRQPLCLLGD
ncbi:hypothetical protein Sjap_024857 [Stephania japonica]|uniref:DNA 3'-5' helicase n=1 Tax=Stephania japonica TaxID=461633 RepID=A0AAP0HQI0_9MAGN